MKILIADDQPSVHQFLEKALRWDFYGITELLHAYNGREALEQIQGAGPELMILDIKMPLLNGLELLQQLKGRSQQPKIIILSAYNEFEYAREAMKYGVKNYILKPIDPEILGSAVAELIGEKQEELILRAEHCLAEILRHPRPPEPSALQALEEAFAALHIDKYLSALVTRRHSLPGSAAPGQRDAATVGYPNLMSVAVDSEVLYLLIPIPASQPEAAICQTFVKMIQSWNRQTNPEQNYVIAFSESGAAARDLHKTYLQAEKAVQMRFYQEDTSFFHYNVHFRQLPSERSETAKKNLLDALRMNFPAPKIMEYLKELFQSYRAEKLLPEMVRQSCQEILLVMKACDAAPGCNQPGKDEPEEDSNAVFRINQRMDDLEAAMLKAIRAARPQAVKPEQGIVREIKKYTETNYRDELSLDTIAKKFFISKFQLCRLFKKETGINYWDFVTRVRMEKALLLLANTELKSYEIAFMVGYDDICHFSTLFKKFYGKSPKQYRKEILAKSDSL